MQAKIEMQCPRCLEWTSAEDELGNTEVDCEDCGSHCAFLCEHCKEVVDLVFKDLEQRKCELKLEKQET